MKSIMKAVVAAAAVWCVVIPAETAFAAKVRHGTAFSGKASWYGPGFHGKKTASGERFNQNALTAAHPSLPFGTKVKVTNVHNGESVVVRINDRGPYKGGRVIDLSKAAAEQVGLRSRGVGAVKVEVVR